MDFTESPSALNWTERSVSTWKGTVLPETFAELEKIPLDRSFNFLMSLDKESIDKEVSILGIEAHMFWEQKTVKNDFDAFCRKWFFGDHKAYLHGAIVIPDEPPSQATLSVDASNVNAFPSTVIVDSEKEKRQCIELGFVDKLIELWKLRKRILEDKTEITVSGFLQRYTHEMGKAFMGKTMQFKSTYIARLFKDKNKEVTMEEKNRAAMVMYNYEIALYKALLLQCEREYDLLINVKLYQELVIPHFTLKHGQYAAVAVIRSGANKLLKKVWEAFISKRDKIILREHAKVVQNQRKFDTQLKTAQLSAGQQSDDKFSGLDATVRGIIKDTVKNQYIKKESFVNDESSFENEPFYTGKQSRFTQGSLQQQSTTKRSRMQDAIDLRSPASSSTTRINRRKSRRKDFFLKVYTLQIYFPKV